MSDVRRPAAPQPDDDRRESTRPGFEFGPILTDYVRVLYRRRWTALAVVAIVVGAVAAYTFTAEPVYQARLQLLIESDTPNVVAFEEVLDESQAQATYYQTQYELLRSRALARLTIEALDLWEHPALQGGSRGLFGVVRSLRNLVGGPDDRTGAPAQAAGAGGDAADYDPAQAGVIGRFLAGLRITPVRFTRLVNVEFRSSDPTLAAEVANTHARHYMERSIELRTQASREATEWLTERLAEERRRVEEKELALQAFREQHDGVSLEEGQDIIVQQLADLNAAMTRAKTRRLEVEARFRQLAAAQRERDRLDSFPAILDNPLIQQLKVDLARLQRERSELAQTLGERHPRLTEKISAIETTEARLESEIRKVVESVGSEYRSALAEENSLATALEEQTDEALALNRRGVEYGVLQREAESARQVYDALLQRVRETDVSTELRASNIRVIDPAEPPLAPIAPRTRFNLLMAVLSGSALALGLVFFLESMDERIRTPDHVRASLGLPFFGLIPKIGDATPGEPPSVLGGTPFSFVEAVRVIRSNLMYRVPPQAGARSIVVASTARGEGKTVVALNLAVALAQAGERVLLIDGDQRDPSVHTTLGESLRPGLTEVLRGEVEAGYAYRLTMVSRLTVITAGATTEDPPALLGSQGFQALLAEPGPFDWVIVDSPPVMAVADATALARAATGVLFVVGADMTGRRAAGLAIEHLLGGGGRIVGTVLNMADLERHPYYYSPYYGREYGESLYAAAEPQHESLPIT